MNVDVTALARWYACRDCEDVTWFDVDATCFVCGGTAVDLAHRPQMKDGSRVAPAPEGTRLSRFGAAVEA